MGLNPASLRDAEAEIECSVCGPRRFKKREPDDVRELIVTECLAMRAAALAAFATATPFAGGIQRATDLRNMLLAQNPSYVDLRVTLDYLWRVGIPVVHLSRFPRNAKKMQGLTVKLAGRPAIVITDGSTSPAWLLFVIAHEIGHIASGHLTQDVPKVDENIKSSVEGPEEREANEYAVELVNGDRTTAYKSPYRISAEALVDEARRISAARHVDPGAIALNYGRTTGFWNIAMAALKDLEAGADGPAIIRDHMMRNLDWERLPEESQNFLKRITGSAAEE